jgi:hypothetical protein
MRDAIAPVSIRQGAVSFFLVCLGVLFSLVTWDGSRVTRICGTPSIEDSPPSEKRGSAGGEKTPRNRGVLRERDQAVRKDWLHRRYHTWWPKPSEFCQVKRAAPPVWEFDAPTFRRVAKGSQACPRISQTVAKTK